MLSTANTKTLDKLFNDLTDKIKSVIPYKIESNFIFKCLTQTKVKNELGIEKSSPFEESSDLIRIASDTLSKCYKEEIPFEIFIKLNLEAGDTSDYNNVIHESNFEIKELFRTSIIRLYISLDGNLAYQLFTGHVFISNSRISLRNKESLNVDELLDITRNDRNNGTLIREFYFYNSGDRQTLVDLTLFFYPPDKRSFKIFAIKFANFYTNLFNKSGLQTYKVDTKDRVNPILSDPDLISRRLYQISHDKKTNQKYTNIMELVIKPKYKNLLYFFLLAVMKMAHSPVMKINIGKESEDRLLLTIIKLFPTLFRS